MTKYICSQCTGRSAEEHTFHLNERPRACPYCGTQEDYHLETIEEYLRERLDDMEFEKELKEEKVDELREEVERLKAESDQ